MQKTQAATTRAAKAVGQVTQVWTEVKKNESNQGLASQHRVQKNGKVQMEDSANPFAILRIEEAHAPNQMVAAMENASSLVTREGKSYHTDNSLVAGINPKTPTPNQIVQPPSKRQTMNFGKPGGKKGKAN
ncbi:hypothetical protein QJS10_CPB20g00798 [Acorus calamus]|uniref:Uncharacterized protein n=1 Tax=Acorus calamus TaxID=4465 RepID=A0AAV9CDZ7_ACOCL|nr:hypothetical protein QJS10_CPB20g00798 [Acorus calamus]